MHMWLSNCIVQLSHLMLCKVYANWHSLELDNITHVTYTQLDSDAHAWLGLDMH